VDIFIRSVAKSKSYQLLSKMYNAARERHFLLEVKRKHAGKMQTKHIFNIVIFYQIKNINIFTEIS